MQTWCADQGIDVTAVYSETDVSGRKPLAKRHGLKQAVEDVERGASQMILTAYFDRFVRSVNTRAEVLIRVEDNCGGSVMTLDMGRTSNATPVSKFSGVVLAAAAELIADQAGEKTHVTKQRNIDNGIPPFPRITIAYQRIESGDDKGKLEQHPVNGPLVAEAARRRIAGASYVQLSRWFAENGVEISTSGVESTLSSKLLIGEIHFGKFTPNLHAIANPVLDRATFAKMHATKVSRGRYAKSERLLARQGILICRTCGSRMTAQSTKQGRYSYYVCNNRTSCSAPANVAADAVESFMRDELIRLGNDVVGQATTVLEIEDARVAAESAQQKLSSTILLLTDLAHESATSEVLATLSCRGSLQPPTRARGADGARDDGELAAAHARRAA
jgi:DNA invertase Pin-like site-specific DNA recombinase